MSYKPDQGWEEPVTAMLGRWALTLLAICVLILLSIVPFGAMGEIRPSFMMMAVYYWAIMRPATLSPPAAFAAGAAYDLLAGVPFGLNALTLVLVQWITRLQRKFLLGQPFLVMWAGLGLVALGASLLQWGLVCLFDWRLMSVKPALMSALLTAAFYPLAVMPLSAFNKTLAGRKSPL